MKKILLLIFLDAFFIFSSAVFTVSFVKYYDWAFFVPCLAFSITTILLSYLLIIEIFLGHKIYTYDNSSLYIWRKGKMKKCIQKENTSKIVLTLDVFTEELHIISFVYEDKKYYVSINQDNEEDILKFVSGKDFTKKKNWWYYLIAFFSQ